MIGAGGIGMIVGVVFAILAANTHADYLATSQASPDLIGLRDDGKVQALGADLGLFIGGAVVAGGVLTLLLTSGPTQTPDELLNAAIVPIDGGAAFVLGGTFP